MAELRGLCAKYDPEIWFPLPKDDATAAVAKSVCARCPIQGECLTEALDRNYEFGVWGGMTEDERRAFRRRGGRIRATRMVDALA